MASLAPKTVRAVELEGDPYDSRHAPRRILCKTKDDEFVPYWVKLCRSKLTAAANMSEFLATLAMKHGGGVISTLDVALVEVSDTLYAVATNEYPDATPNVGVHFGTVWRDDVEKGPLTLDLDSVQWHQLATLWVYDKWLKNGDRHVSGNVLVERLTGNFLRVIASDQSDCFGGTLNIIDGGSRMSSCSSSVTTAAINNSGSPLTLEALLLLAKSKYKDIATSAYAHCESMLACAEQVARIMPTAWGEVAKTSPDSLVGFLQENLHNLKTNFPLDFDSPPDEVTKGGILIEVNGTSD